MKRRREITIRRNGRHQTIIIEGDDWLTQIIEMANSEGWGPLEDKRLEDIQVDIDDQISYHEDGDGMIIFLFATVFVKTIEEDSNE